MTYTAVKRLNPGDAIYWNDPDSGIASRTLVIRSIDASRPDLIVIEAADDSVLECLPRELSRDVTRKGNQ